MRETIQSTLLKAYQAKDKNIFISKTNSTVATAKLLSLLHQVKQPHLILLPTSKDIKHIITDLTFFGFSNKNIFSLPAFDVGPESGLYPNSQVIAQRLRWLYHAFKKDNGIYLATAESFCLSFSSLVEVKAEGGKTDKAVSKRAISLLKFLNSILLESLCILCFILAVNKA